MKLRAFSCLLGFVVLSTPAAAQKSTGTMSGTVKDAQGAALRGVTVSVSSAALVGARKAVTGSTGTYQFAALPPGAFTVRFERSGYKTLKRERVEIHAALKTSVDAAMGMGAMEGTIVVGGEARTIDATTATETRIDGVVLTLDPREGDLEAGDVRIDGKKITEIGR